MRHFLLICFLLCLLPMALCAQTARIDSLNHVLSEQEDTARISTLNQLAIEWIYIDPNKSIEPAQDAFDIGTGADRLEDAGLSANIIGSAHMQLGQFEQGIEWLERSIAYYDRAGSQKKYATYNNLALVYQGMGELKLADSVLNVALTEAQAGGLPPLKTLPIRGNMANNYQLTGRYEEALETYQDILEVELETGQLESMRYTLSSMGLLYNKLKDFENALRYYDYAQRVAYRLKDTLAAAMEVRHKAMTLNEMQALDSALVYAGQGIELVRQSPEPEDLMEAYGVLGSTYLYLGELDSAAKYYTLENEIADKAGYREASGDNHLTNGILKFVQKDYAAAVPFLRKGLKAARQSESLLNQQEALHYLALSLRELGRADEAFDCYRRSIILRDSLYSTETAERIGRLNAEHDQRLADLQTEMVEEAAERQRRQRNNFQYLLATSGVFVLLIVSLVLGRARVNPRLAQALLFFTMLVIIEFLIITIDPFIVEYTGGVPIPTLIANAILAVIFTFVHRVVESRLLQRKDTASASGNSA